MMLPSVPKSLGRLSDVFISALGSITGKHNRLALPKSSKTCVVLVDGLGTKNLEYRAGHAPFLVEALKASSSISCGFPSTTVASIASFATGLRAGQHGLVGYQILDSKTQLPLNVLTGMTTEQALEMQPNQTVAELASQSGVQAYCIGPGEYENSAFSVATMRGAKYVAAKTFDDRVTAALEILGRAEKALIYFYVPELDQTAHAFGSRSGEWVAKLEDLDSAMSRLTKKLPAGSGLLVTADHGIIDISHDKQIYLDEFEGLDSLVSVGGDPRVLFLYLGHEPNQAQIDELQAWLGKRVFVATRQQIIDAGWYSEVSDAAKSRMPDLFLISVGECALYHRKFAKPKSLQMIGQHGALSPEELTVPLIKLGAFSPRL
jgi:predicted AlkP superfamily pyrophosphatase or phosphodiesterase